MSSSLKARVSAPVAGGSAINPVHFLSTLSLPFNFKNAREMADQVLHFDKELDKILGKQPIALQLERQSGLKKTHLVYAVAGLLLSAILYRFAPEFVLVLVLFAYPLVQTLEAVESHDKAKDAHILAYWSVVASLHLSETLLPFIRYYVPFYRLMKLALCVWMFLPQTKGSLVVYSLAFKPLLAHAGQMKKASASRPRAAVPIKPVVSAENLSKPYMKKHQTEDNKEDDKEI